jgi:hypothetical protein
MNERTRIARKAAQARWTANGREIHRAIDTGRVSVGDLSFSCAVLDNESRVISGTEFMKVMGIYRSGALSTRRHEDVSGVYFPLYLAHKNLRPFIFEDIELVRALSQPIVYREPESQSLAEGIQADVLRRICTVWVRAHAAGVLGPSQVIVAEKAQKLVEALADVAIIALIDEATGYQKRRARDELQKILAAYIAPELMPWQKRFPNTYYEQLHRVWGWEYIVGSNAGTACPRGLNHPFFAVTSKSLHACSMERQYASTIMPASFLLLCVHSYFRQREAAAFRAISFRRLAVMPSARAFPPFRPSATAAGSFPSDSGSGP